MMPAWSSNWANRQNKSGDPEDRSCGTKRPDAFGIFGLELPPRHLQVVMALEIQPELGTIAKVQAQPKRCVRCNTPPIVNDLGNPVRRNPNSLREAALRQPIGREEFLLQHFARRDRRKFIFRHRSFLSMIVHDLDFVRLAVDPFEDHPPLVIDPDRMKVSEGTLELLQPVRRWNGQIFQPACCVDRFELALSRASDTRELTHPFIPE